MNEIQPSAEGQNKGSDAEGAQQEITARGPGGPGQDEAIAKGEDAGQQDAGAEADATVEEDAEEEDAGEEGEDADPAVTEARLREEVAKAEEELGPEDPGLFLPLVNLSAHLWKQLQHEETEAVTRRLLAIVEKTEGPNARRTASSRLYLSHILVTRERYEEAEDLLRQVIAHHRETEGKSCSEVAALLGELAVLKLRRGRKRQARALCRRAMRMMSRTAGRLDSKAVQLLVTVAGVYHKLHKDVRAIRLYRRALKRCDRVGTAVALTRKLAELSLGEVLRSLALQHQEAGRIPDALARAGELVQLSPALGYPLAADIHEEAGDVVSAQRVLEAGVKALPQSGDLWERLGDLYGQQALLGEAAHAYERALSCPDVDAGRVRYQAGLNSKQRERPLEALEHLWQVGRDNLDDDDEHLLWEARSQRLMLLRQLGREPEMRALAEEVLTDIGAAGAEPSSDDDEGETASLLCLGRALLYLRGDRAAARACATQAFRRDPDNLCLGLLRESASLPLDPARTRCLRITITLPRRDPDSGARRTFSRTYVVVTDSISEGLSFIRALEETEDAGPVSLSEWTRLDIPPVGVRGVHGVSEYRDA